MFNVGISKEGNLIDVAVEHKIIQKSGSWLSYGDDRLGQGRENAKQYLKDNFEIMQQIENEIRQAVGQVVPHEEVNAVEEEELGEVPQFDLEVDE